MPIMYLMMGSFNEIDCDVKKWGTQIETKIDPAGIPNKKQEKKIANNNFKRSTYIKEVQEELVDIQLQDIEGNFDMDADLTI